MLKKIGAFISWVSNKTGFPVGLVFIILFSFINLGSITSWDFLEICLILLQPIPFACCFWFFDRKDFWKRPKNRSKEFDFSNHA